MFGGLELKAPGSQSSSSQNDTKTTTVNDPSSAENKKNDEMEDAIGSAFSFLQSSLSTTPVPPLPGTNAIESEISKAIAIVPNEQTDSAMPIETETKSDAPSSSGFSFMATSDYSNNSSTNVTSDTNIATEDPGSNQTNIDVSHGSSITGSGSGFSFMTSPDPPSAVSNESLKNTTLADAVDSNLPTKSLGTDSGTALGITENSSSGFSFLSKPSDSSPNNNTINTWGAPSSSLPVETTSSGPSDLISMPPTTSIPATSGMVFGSVAPKKNNIKKRRATKKIGIGSSNANVPINNNNNMNPSTTSSLSSNHSLPPTMPSTQTPIKNNDSAPSFTSPSAKDDAEETRRKAEEFLAEKLRAQVTSQHQQSKLNLPDYSESTKEKAVNDSINAEEPESPTFKVAQAAAKEAQRVSQKDTTKKRSNFRMGHIFSKGRGNLPFFRDSSQDSINVPPTPQNSLANINANSSVNNDDEDESIHSTEEVAQDHMIMPHYEVNQPKSISSSITTKYEQTNVSIQGQPKTTTQYSQSISEVEEAERIMEFKRKEELAKKRAKELEEQEQQEQLRIAQLEQEEKEKLEAAKPENKCIRLMNQFELATQKAMDRVAQLRSHRKKLIDEFATAEKRESLASHQINQAEAQQMAAAEKEDFDLADRLGTVIDGYESEKNEQKKILDHIQLAISEVDNQREEVVNGLTFCFTDIKDKLSAFEQEQENVEREDGTEALEQFAVTAKKLSGEDVRLNNELKHIERDEDILNEERKQIENSIFDQCKEEEGLRVETSVKLAEVNDEIEALQKLLETKELVAKDLSRQLAGHEESIKKVRNKFSRQLTRLSKKDFSVKENRKEWELEKATLDKMKANHEDEVQAHHEALLSHEKMIKSVKIDVDVASRFEELLRKEIDVNNLTGISDGEDDELKNLQADVVKSEAVVAESKQMVAAAEGVISSLQDEIEQIDVRLPILEAEKRLAASKRDFKGAGKASKEIKEMKARKEHCLQEIEGDAQDQLSAATAELEKLEVELEEKKSVTHEKEKETGILNMVKIAQKIKRLEKAKSSFSEEAECSQKEISVVIVGSKVLDEEIKVLVLKGESLDEKFGGWNGILNEVSVDDEAIVEADEVIEQKKEPETAGKDDEEDAKSEEKNEEETETIKEDDGVNERNKAESNSSHENEDDKINDEEVQNEEEVTIAEETVLKWQELTKRLQETESAIEIAVEKEDYDEAAELDEILQTIQSSINDLGVSEEELRAKIEEKDN